MSDVVIHHRARPIQPIAREEGAPCDPPASPPRAPQAGNYRVGYGKPPADRQFKPGQSGNPKGRPRGRKNLETIVEEVLFEPFTVTDRGRQRKMAAVEVGLRRLRQKVVEGDLKSLAFFLKELARYDSLRQAGNAEVVDDARALNATDQMILDMFAEDVRAASVVPADDEGSI